VGRARTAARWRREGTHLLPTVTIRTEPAPRRRPGRPVYCLGRRLGRQLTRRPTERAPLGPLPARHRTEPSERGRSVGDGPRCSRRRTSPRVTSVRDRPTADVHLDPTARARKRHGLTAAQFRRRDGVVYFPLTGVAQGQYKTIHLGPRRNGPEPGACDVHLRGPGNGHGLCLPTGGTRSGPSRRKDQQSRTLRR